MSHRTVGYAVNSKAWRAEHSPLEPDGFIDVDEYLVAWAEAGDVLDLAEACAQHCIDEHGAEEWDGVTNEWLGAASASIDWYPTAIGEALKEQVPPASAYNKQAAAA